MVCTCHPCTRGHAKFLCAKNETLQTVQCARKLNTLAEEASVTTQELQIFDAFDSLRSCVRAVDSAVRFRRNDTAPVASLTVASSRGFDVSTQELSARRHGLALCGTRKMRGEIKATRRQVMGGTQPF